MKITKLAAAVAVAFGVTMMTACETTEQDSGDNPDIASGLKLSGTIVDGYVARAVVYVDLNENGELDPFESWAMTDNDGKIGSNGSTDYCADTATEEQARFCLQANLPKGETVTLRTHGGYDIYTGEPFSGSMTQRVAVGDDGTIDSFANTPLTTFLQAAYSATSVAESTLAENLATAVDTVSNTHGITSADVRSDFFENSDTDVTAKQKRLIMVALKLHKTVDAIATQIDNKIDNLGLENTDKPSDVTRYVYESLAEEWVNGGYPKMDGFLGVGASTDLGSITAAAVADIKADPDYSVSALDMTSEQATVGAIAQRVAETVDNVDIENASASGSDTVLQAIQKRARAVEIVAITARRPETVADQTGLTNAATMVQDPNVVDSLDDTVDVGYTETLAAAATDTASLTTSINNSKDPTLRPKLFSTSESVEGRKVALASDEAGSTDKVILYMQTGTNGEGGAVACVRFSGDGGYDTGDGARYEGSWSKLSDYSVLLNMDVAGSNEAMIVKSVVRTGGLSTGTIRLAYDYGDEGLQEWDTGETVFSNAFQTFSSVPSDDAACVTALGQ